MKTHPAADIFPVIEGVAFSALVADVEANGLAHPIITLDGLVLDGRNRLRACYEAKVKPRFEKYAGKDPYGYVMSANIHRRHLDESQRAMVAAKLRAVKIQDATFSASEGKTAPCANLHTESKAEAARALHVSPRSVASATKVLERGAAVTIKAVESGGLAVSRAAKIADLPKTEQRAAVAEALDPEAHDYTEEDGRREYAADFEAMAKIIDADDKLGAAVGELRVARKHAYTLERMVEDKGREVEAMKREASRWMRKAKKASACPACVAALGKE